MDSRRIRAVIMMVNSISHPMLGVFPSVNDLSIAITRLGICGSKVTRERGLMVQAVLVGHSTGYRGLLPRLAGHNAMVSLSGTLVAFVVTKVVHRGPMAATVDLRC